MDPITVTKQPNGQILVGDTLVSEENLEAKLKELAPGGNFSVNGQMLSVDSVIAKFNSGEISTTTLTLPAPGDTGNIDFEALSQKLTSSVSMVEELMRLFHEIALEGKESARQGRAVARESEQANIAQQVEKIKAAAEKAFSAAIVNAVVQIVAGAVAIAGGMIGIGKAASAAKSAQAGAAATTKASIAGDIADDASKAGNVALKTEMTSVSRAATASASAANAASAKASAVAQAAPIMGQAIGQVGSGLGGIISAFYTQDSEELKAEATKEEAAAKVASYLVQDESEWMNNLKDLIRDIQQKLASIQQAEAETKRGIARA